MMNYRVAPALLAPYVPPGTELDCWQGAAYLSVVGFLFRRTRVLGIPVPFHREFEEVNLRFYVRREVDGEVRRAVTFVKEIVPRTAIAAVARLVYNEPYVALPMRHVLEHPAATGDDGAPGEVRYAWRQPSSGWSTLRMMSAGRAQEIASGSEAEFITEHYWGYTRQRDGSTVEYRVTHPRWRVWSVTEAAIDANLSELYGPTIAAALVGPPSSAFLAEGSTIAVHRPTRLQLPNERTAV